MIHGRDRDAVVALADKAASMAAAVDCPREILFSSRRFKQRGARYATGAGAET
jgi:hypothetical protein